MAKLPLPERLEKMRSLHTQHAAEMNAGMDEHQQRSRPGQPLMATQQSHRIAGREQPALAQRVAQRDQDQGGTGNTQVAADPDRIGEVQQQIQQQRRGGECRQCQHEGQDLAIDQAAGHRSSTSEEPGVPTQSRQWPGAGTWPGSTA